MTAKKQKAFLWFDPEAGNIEIEFGAHEGAGDMMHTDDERIVLRLNDEGEIIGIMLHSISTFMQGEKPREMEVVPRKGGPPRPKRAR